MRILIASDIHGSSYYCQLLMEAFEREKADRMLLLGDILYHGPRNDLPREYAPKEVITMLNQRKDRILCVRGNCDTDVDQMVLEFPILAEYAVVFAGTHLIYAAHGHNFNENHLPPLQKGDILLNGHTHVPGYVEYSDYVYMNPGSVSIPKENSKHSYMIFEGNTFTWKALEDGTEYISYQMK